MHYCLRLFTKNIPSKEDIEKIMAPYDEDAYFSADDAPHPLFLWDYYTIGGRYNGNIKIDIKRMYPDNPNELWIEGKNHVRNGRLFYSSLLSERVNGTNPFNFETDYFGTMGANEGFLFVDGAFAAHLHQDFLNEEEEQENIDDPRCYIFIDMDGNAFAKEHWDGHDWVNCRNEFAVQYRRAYLEFLEKNGFLTILDLHD